MAILRRLTGWLAAGAGLAVTMLTATRSDSSAAKGEAETTSGTNPNAPNILLFVLDDLDADTLQKMLDANQLPNIKSRIIDRGVNFQNTYVPCSICTPSRASLLTGKFSHNHGVWHVVGNEGPNRFDTYLNESGNAYLPTWLGSNYYRAFVGKYHLGNRHPQWDFYRPVVDGYDPRPGMYRVRENGVDKWPAVYQTKYIGDAAKAAITASGDKPLFLLVAPTPIHVNVSGWHQKSAYASGKFAGTPVAFTNFPNGTGWRQHLVTVEYSTGAPVYQWWQRDSAQRDSGWGDWVRTGDAASIAPNTGSGEVVGWNILLPAPNTRRQQLIRQSGAKVQFYSRDLVTNEPATPWALAADEAILAGTGSLPVAGWSAAIFPSGVIRQQVIRGSETLGYVSYIRHRAAAGGPFTPWRLDPDWGESVVFGRLCGFTLVPTGGARYVVQLIVRRPGATKFEWWQSGELVDFHELAAGGSTNRAGQAVSPVGILEEGRQYRDPAMNYDPKGHVVRDRDDAGLGTESVPDGQTTIVTEVHPYLMLRCYAEGSWSPVAPGQTYNYGSSYPAGSLRKNRDPHGFEPFSAQYDLPRAKGSFNRQLDSRIPFYSPATWPDLTNPVPGGKQQQDYLSRLYLDRMEQMLSVDRMVGEVMDAAGPNTIVIFTSDNGHFNGEHRLSNKLAPQEESVRVPLYIRSPQGVRRDVTLLAATIDIAPTILDYAGRAWANPNFNVDGRSLRPHVEGATGPAWRRSLLLEYHQPRGLSGSRGATDWRFGLPDYLGLRQLHETRGESVNTVYIQYYRDVADLTSILDYEYYRLDVDPNQTTNLATGRIIELDRILGDFYTAGGEEARQQDMQWWPPES